MSSGSTQSTSRELKKSSAISRSFRRILVSRCPSSQNLGLRCFLMLKEEKGRKFAYIFSSAMFALYHVGMTSGWFNILIYILSMAGLFIGGCIFNYLNEKCENIYPSWLVHMCANFGINTIGFILFEII